VAQFPEEAERRDWLGKFYYRPPGGESWADVALRVRGVLTDLAHTEKHDRVLITAHDVVLLLFCYVAEGLNEKEVLDRARTNGLRNAAICRIRRDEESPTGWTVTDYNLDAHLREEGVEVTDQPGASDEVGGEDA
jgi:broad specificity phosphatase PhoE